MKKLLVILAIVLFSTTAFAQTIDLQNKEWYSRTEIGAAPPTWNGSSYAHIPAWQIPANTMCIPQADANCNLFIAPGAGVIWEVRVRDGNGATLADVVQFTGTNTTMATNDYLLATDALVGAVDVGGGGHITIFGLDTQADNIINTINGLATSSFLYGFDGATWDRWDMATAGASYAATVNAMYTKSSSYYYDTTGTQWLYWTGAQMNADNLAATTNAPRVANFNYGYDGATWDRVGAPTHADNLGNATVGLNSSSFVYGYDGATWDRIDAPTHADNLPNATNGLNTGSFNYGYDGATWDRVGAPTHADNLANTTVGLNTGSVTYGYDGATWDRVGAPTHADDLANTTNGLNTSAFMYAYDGTTWDRVLVGASGEVQMTDVATRPGEDAGNDWRSAEKAETVVYNPAVTTGTAVDDAGTDIVCASTYVLNLPNWSVFVKNAGGGSGDAFTDVDVQISYNGTDWSSETSTACDALTSGNSARCFKGATESAAYARVVAATGAGDDTTADCVIQGNKN